MCGIASLPRRDDDDRDLALFVHVLREVFDHERWADVEPCARRAWNQIALITGVPWEEVRESIRSSWQPH